MASGNDNDWRVPLMREFANLCQQQNVFPYQKNTLIRMLHEFAEDHEHKHVSEELRAGFHRVCTQQGRAQMIFVTMSAKYWTVEIPPIGLRQEDEPAAQVVTDRTAIQPGASPEPPQKTPVVVRAPLQLESCESVVGLILDNTYDHQHVAKSVEEWFNKEYPDSGFSVLAHAGKEKRLDLHVRTNCMYSQVAQALLSVAWIKSVVSKPVSDFGYFWACAE